MYVFECGALILSRKPWLHSSDSSFLEALEENVPGCTNTKEVVTNSRSESENGGTKILIHSA